MPSAGAAPRPTPRRPLQAPLNLTRPEKSLLLLAPLARKTGGLGLCKSKAPAAKPRPWKPRTTDDELDEILAERNKKPPDAAVFADATDRDYHALLAAVRAAKTHLDRIKRFDMPGFRPNVHYIREMTRYGVLPPTLGPNDPIDVYAADQAYWRSFWYRRPAACVGSAKE